MTDKSTTELKPCPFCGGPVELERAGKTRSMIRGEREWWGVVCRNTLNRGGTCAIQQIPSASKEAAIDRWNRRSAAHGEPSKEVSDSEREFITKRLRRVAKIVGLENAIPDDDDLLECAGSVLGMIASQLERQAGSAEQASEREAFEAWAITRGLHLPKRPDGEYASVTTQEAWDSWQARAALNQQGEQTAPEGFVIVPKEPTPEMRAAGYARLTQRIESDDNDMGPAYRAMIAAAPSTAQKDGGK